MGSWKWITGQEDGDDQDPDEEPGGLTLQGAEKFVVVEPEKATAGDVRWEVRWDKNDDGLKGVAGMKGQKVLGVSLERTFLEEKERPVKPKEDK